MALLIRRVEERIVSIYASDKIQSPVHLSIGQEPAAVGVCAALRPEDKLFINYRSHAYYLAKGGDLPAMMAELYGKSDGCCGGKGGSMHLAAPSVGVMGASAVVAATIPQAVGMALAQKMKGEDAVSTVVFGDGATEEGVYHEALNFAALHSLPILFICENNGLAVHSPLKARQSYRMADQARLYGMKPKIIENGMDMAAIADAAEDCLSSIRSGDGPAWLEIHTCRYKEHVGPGDDWEAGYRDSGTLKKWQSKDPLLAQPEKVREFEQAVENDIDRAMAFAEQSPFPAAEMLLADV